MAKKRPRNKIAIPLKGAADTPSQKARKAQEESAAKQRADEKLAIKQAETAEAEAKASKKKRQIVWALMGTMLILFIIIALWAPDTANASGKASAETKFWRLLFLLAPMAFMYALLGWDKIAKFIKR